MKVYRNVFEKIISLENLFLAWDNFKRGKRRRTDILRFEWELEENIFQLHRDLKSERYKHGPYRPFYISDPKKRLIHKAKVRDRIVHHAVFNILNPIFEPTFIAHSFSCRVGKGTHKGVDTLEKILRKVSKNYTAPCFALKCDIEKFFATIDHKSLLEILGKRIKDEKAMLLLEEIVKSYTSYGQREGVKPLGNGMPIGNLTSQLFANIYLNELDQFIKHKLKVKYYVRYTDDFIIVNGDIKYLEDLISPITEFLQKKLNLNLHPRKVTVRKFKQGIDFLGYVVLPRHRVLRTKTKRRIFKKLTERVNEYKVGSIDKKSLSQSLASYLGVLSHANSFKLSRILQEKLQKFLSE